jgi:hypothetical protein
MAPRADTVKRGTRKKRQRGALAVPDPERYAHGTYARYRLGKCRCFDCRVAVTNYVCAADAAKRPPWRLLQGLGSIVIHRETGERIVCADRESAYRERDRLNARHRPKPASELVPTKKVRDHIAFLSARGVGYKSVAAAVGMSTSSLAKIISGEARRTRRQTEERILAVGIEAARGSALVDSHETWKRLDRIIGSGLYSKAAIARWLGCKTPQLQIQRGPHVTAKTAQAVLALYDRLWAEDERLRLFVDPYAEEARREREAAERAAQASRAKLAKALAGWDTDEFAIRFDRFRDVS